MEREQMQVPTTIGPLEPAALQLEVCFVATQGFIWFTDPNRFFAHSL